MARISEKNSKNIIFSVNIHAPKIRLGKIVTKAIPELHIPFVAVKLQEYN